MWTPLYYGEQNRKLIFHALPKTLTLWPNPNLSSHFPLFRSMHTQILDRPWIWTYLEANPWTRTSPNPLLLCLLRFQGFRVLPELCHRTKTSIFTTTLKVLEHPWRKSQRRRRRCSRWLGPLRIFGAGRWRILKTSTRGTTGWQTGMMRLTIGSIQRRRSSRDWGWSKSKDGLIPGMGFSWCLGGRRNGGNRRWAKMRLWLHIQMWPLLWRIRKRLARRRGRGCRFTYPQFRALRMNLIYWWIIRTSHSSMFGCRKLTMTRGSYIPWLVSWLLDLDKSVDCFCCVLGCTWWMRTIVLDYVNYVNTAETKLEKDYNWLVS